MSWKRQKRSRTCYDEIRRIDKAEPDMKLEDIIKIKPADIISSEIEKPKGKKQFILTGAPGTGKTYTVLNFAKAYQQENRGKYKFIQFHSSYDYTDFVEGLKPIETKFTDEDGNIQTKTEFRRVDGVFKAFCREAAEPGNEAFKFFFIIDEINRADLSRVFGELMFSLEESYRGSEHSIITQYHGLPTYDMDGVKLDIDRNVETFDFALRRRFRFFEISAEESLDRLDEILGGISGDVKARAIELNKVITDEMKSEAFQLGQSYFRRIDTADADYKKYFEDELESILREYVRGKKQNDIKTFIDKCRDKFTETITKPDNNTDS